jgi:hypothetical protein
MLRQGSQSVSLLETVHSTCSTTITQDDSITVSWFVLERTIGFVVRAWYIPKRSPFE